MYCDGILRSSARVRVVVLFIRSFYVDVLKRLPRIHAHAFRHALDLRIRTEFEQFRAAVGEDVLERLFPEHGTDELLGE